MTETSASAHRRSPILAYLLQWATSGIYTLLWLNQTMRDLNAMTGRQVFNLRRILAAGRTIFYVFLVWFLTFLFFGEHIIEAMPFGLMAGMGLVMFVLAIVWNGGIVYIHVRIAREIAELYDGRALPGKPSPALAGVLFFVWFAALPYLQTKMNRLIPETVSQDANAEHPNDA